MWNRNSYHFLGWTLFSSDGLTCDAQAKSYPDPQVLQTENCVSRADFLIAQKPGPAQHFFRGVSKSQIVHMYYSLNSLKGVIYIYIYRGLYKGLL